MNTLRSLFYSTIGAGMLGMSACNDNSRLSPNIDTTTTKTFHLPEYPKLADSAIMANIESMPHYTNPDTIATTYCDFTKSSSNVMRINAKFKQGNRDFEKTGTLALSDYDSISNKYKSAVDSIKNVTKEKFTPKGFKQVPFYEYLAHQNYVEKPALDSVKQIAKSALIQAIKWK